MEGLQGPMGNVFEFHHLGTFSVEKISSFPFDSAVPNTYGKIFTKVSGCFGGERG